MKSWGILKKEFFFGLLAMAVFLIAVFFIYDLLFSRPSIHKGIIVEKIFVPSKNVGSGYALSYAKTSRTYKYSITAQRHEQWIAFVKDEDGNVLKVNCQSGHYEKKNVGDTLLFKEYRGQVFKVEYFSHNDEDTLQVDLKKAHLH
jgi:hypothetical protein